MQISWNERFSQRGRQISGSIIRELLKMTEQPGIISFGGGMPAPEVFPVAQIGAATSEALGKFGAQALQYGATEGFRPLREYLALVLNSPELNLTAENVLITTGSQQALDLLGKIFIDSGDFILTESPTYMGALQAWNAYGADYLAIPTNSNGFSLKEVEDALKKNPKFMYLLPNFQNPSGTCISLEDRKKLISLSVQYSVPIVEDDPYRQLRYEGEDIPSLLELDGQMQTNGGGQYRGNVIYLGTFSKILAPGMRLGWVVATPEIIAKLALAKQSVDLHTPSFTQVIAYEVAQTGYLDTHIKLIRDLYKQRRDTMLVTMGECFPSSITWTVPEGGMFLWVTLPDGMDSSELLKDAIEQKVAFVPGAAFHPKGGGKNTMRLNFSNAPSNQIQEGIKRLGQVFQKKLAQLVG